MRKFLILLTISLAACTKIEYELLPPQMEIIVLDFNDNVVPNVDVSIFYNQDDWEQNFNKVTTSTTNNSGSIVFENLEELVYFIKAEKGELNNDRDIVSFSNPLKKGEKRIIKTKIQ